MFAVSSGVNDGCASRLAAGRTTTPRTKSAADRMTAPVLAPHIEPESSECETSATFEGRIRINFIPYPQSRLLTFEPAVLPRTEAYLIRGSFEKLFSQLVSPSRGWI